MKIIPHRHNQIGGCIIEIKTDNARICIDMGAELPSAERDGKVNDKFELAGVTTGDRDCDAVFITHYHGDHVGSYNKVLSGIPVYIGAAAKEIFLAYAKRTKCSPDDIARIENFKTFEAGKAVTVNNDITVTPLLVDHSAFDAYMFLVESGGKRILHTGDFRTHGFKGKNGDVLRKVLQTHVKTVDVLITECTTLSRPAGEKVDTEHELQQRTRAEMAANKFVFVYCASTNIDRIAAFYHNAIACKRTFFCDDYQKDVLEIVRKHAGHKTSLYNFDADTIKSVDHDSVSNYCRNGFCILVKDNTGCANIMNRFHDDGFFILSMWDGYRNEKVNAKLAKFLKKHDFETFHTSGHATADAIKMVCSVVNPKKILPIHGENVVENVRKLGLQCDVLDLQDGEEKEI